jgi:hypothetical protein
MTITTNPHPDVPLPAGAAPVCAWEPGPILSEDETREWRLIHGATRRIPDNNGYIHLRATQYSDGSLDDLGICLHRRR